MSVIGKDVAASETALATINNECMSVAADDEATVAVEARKAVEEAKSAKAAAEAKSAK